MKLKLSLEKTLYIPTSTVQLISISVLVTGMCVSITFRNTGVTILDDTSGMLLASGPLIPGCHLYTLDLQNALVKHALTAQHSFNVDTWHWTHANYQVITKMACTGLLPGMLPAPLPTLPKCDLCILVVTGTQSAGGATRVLEIE